MLACPCGHAHAHAHAARAHALWQAFLGAWLKGKDWGEYVKPKPGSV